METKNTAVEWLFKQLWEEPKDKMVWYAILDKAKEMEKEQIIDACNLQRNDYRGMPTYNKSGEQYYNETYGK
jgi:hypothetical protein